MHHLDKQARRWWTNNRDITLKYLPWRTDPNLNKLLLGPHPKPNITNVTHYRLLDEHLSRPALNVNKLRQEMILTPFATLFSWNITFPARIAFLSATVTVSNVSQTLLNVRMRPQTASDLAESGREENWLTLVHVLYPPISDSTVSSPIDNVTLVRIGL